MKRFHIFFRSVFIILALTTFVLSGTTAPRAAQGEAARPIQIEADRMESNTNSDTLQFIGNVEAAQGDLIIIADQMTVFYESSRESGEETTVPARKVDTIFAEGHVKIHEGEWQATGDALEYFAVERKVLLTGNASVRQDDNLVRGERIVLHLDEGKSVVERSGGQRVKAYIYPENKE